MSMSLEQFFDEYFRTHPSPVQPMPQPPPFPNGRCQNCGYPLDDHTQGKCPK